MPTAPPRKIADSADAIRCLEAISSSGSSLWAWARANGVNARSLNVWKVRLGPSAAGGAAPSPRLVELVAAPIRSGAYRLQVGDVVVELDSGFDEGTVTRLLRAVRAC